MDSAALPDLIIVLASPFVGSFLAVLVDRLPRSEDVVVSRSACRSCGTALGPQHLVPILSFAVLRGRCATCKAAIPPWLMYVELLAIGAAVLTVIRGGGPAELALNAAFLWVLLTLAATDMKWFRLPDVLTAVLAMVAFGLAVLPGGIGVWQAALGAALGAGVFMALRLGYQALRGQEGLGLGDVKLMVGLGAYVGPFDLPLLVLIAAMAALIGAALTAWRSGTPLKATRAAPFGAALSAAAVVIWLL